MIARRPALWLLALCLALRVVSVFRPCLSDDEATYAVVGREMLTGHALYRDVVDHKPPAIYLVNEATQAIAGPVGGMVLLHVLLILVVWATGLVLGAIAARFTEDRRVPVVAALLWLVFTTTLVDTDSLAANCELFMMLPLSASVWAFLAARHAVAGALVGIAMLFKYQAGIQLPLYGVALIVQHRRELAKVAIGGVALAVGTALPVAAAVLWLYARGAWDAAWFWFRFNFAYIDAGASGALYRQMALRVVFVLVAAAPLYVFAGLAARKAPRFVLGWAAASAVAVLVGGRFFGHYFHQLTAPLAVIAAPAALAFALRRRAVFAAMLAVPAAIFFVLAVAHDPMMRAAGEPDPDYPQVVAWLDAHSTPDDAICIWGNSPVLYFDADRPLGCRFVFANYMTGQSPATPSQNDPTVDSSRNIVPAAWDMLEADLAARQPTFVIDASPGDVAYYGKYPPEKFPRLARILLCRYTSEADVAGLRIYRRLETPRCKV
jgi:hypothetical protein